MADPARRLPENAPGPYFVDETCIDCEQCRLTAKRHFARSEEKGISYVKRQPRTPAEVKRCELARVECPRGAIGREAS